MTGERSVVAEANWEGVPGSTEHRTVGEHRAWCYLDAEWCYSSGLYLCPCCRGVNHDRVWLPRTGSQEYEDMVERLWLHLPDLGITRSNVAVVLEALRKVASD